MNNIILFILLILLLFYYINKEYENYENNDSLGIYSSAATSDPPIEYKEDDKQDDKLKDLFEKIIFLKINKNKNLIKLKEKLELIDQDRSYIELSAYYTLNTNKYPTNKKQEIESLIKIIQDDNNEINKHNKTINSLSSITVNETLQDKDSENDNELKNIYKTY